MNKTRQVSSSLAKTLGSSRSTVQVAEHVPGSAVQDALQPPSERGW